MEVLEKAAAAGFHLVDVELQTAEALKKGQLDKLRSAGAALIVSYHDFDATKDLDKIFERILPFQPEFVKVVSTAKHLSDNVTMMRFLERTRDLASVVGIVMGDQGIISRVLGLRADQRLHLPPPPLARRQGRGRLRPGLWKRPTGSINWTRPRRCTGWLETRSSTRFLR